MPSGPLSDWELAQLLAEPTRREVFECVRRSAEALSRDDVARLTGVNSRLAAFHLDKLSDAGLLLSHYARPPGAKGGPGAGRPAKRYAASNIELDLSMPPRRYEFAARLLAQAIEADPHDAATSAYAVARREGRRMGELRRSPSRLLNCDGPASLLDALAALGYEPVRDDSPTIRLRNCPFRSAADVATDLVCGMSCELVAGLLEGLDLDPSLAVLSPAPPDCCVTVTSPS
jgi:predicted ArsR family transcriptional regulator